MKCWRKSADSVTLIWQECPLPRFEKIVESFSCNTNEHTLTLHTLNPERLPRREHVDDTDLILASIKDGFLSQQAAPPELAT